jgi:GDP/UDP-N,N'-diacetylbacillosamine 2-epimerase (hydrolysing)
MKIGVLTSSRADFGIYLPLLNQMKEDDFFELEIIAFGTHLSKFHGYTLDNILANGFHKIHTISSLLTNDDEAAIATAYGLTNLKFADFWSANHYDLVLCLGDRFEMSAAVQAAIPYNIKFAHFHGGETTLGAVDNIYRHQITLASSLHFTAAQPFSERVQAIKGDDAGIYTVGSLSLDKYQEMDLVQEGEFRSKFNIPDNFVLITFHPETVSTGMNKIYAVQMFSALRNIAKKIDLVITMPNADTMGTVFRDVLTQLQLEYPENVKLIENFGKVNYFSAMSYCKFLLGNTSSGIIEAASFNKYVINVGDRQKGRAQSENTFNCSFNSVAIEDAVNSVLSKGEYKGSNIYYKENTVETIVKVLKTI